MLKIHLLFKKEEIDEEKMRGKVAVVFDVLLATSTITSALYYGAKEVIPVLNKEEAEREALNRDEGSYLLIGEYEGKAIENFLEPNPLKLKEAVTGKTVILSTTNGTVAIRKSSTAKKVYISSLLNGKAVASEILESYENETIVLVCSGSSGEFSLEDFFGAGYFINVLIKNDCRDYDLTDAAMAAHEFFKGTRNFPQSMLMKSQVGKMIYAMGFEEEIRFVATKSLSVVPFLNENKITI